MKAICFITIMPVDLIIGRLISRLKALSAINYYYSINMNLKIGIIPILKWTPVIYCKFKTIFNLLFPGNLITSSSLYLTSSFLCKHALYLTVIYIISLHIFRLFVISDPDIERFNIMSTDSSCLMGILCLVVVLLLLNLLANNCFIINNKSPLFLAAFFALYRILMLFCLRVSQLSSKLKWQYSSLV